MHLNSAHMQKRGKVAAALLCIFAHPSEEGGDRPTLAGFLQIAGCQWQCPFSLSAAAVKRPKEPLVCVAK